MKIRGHRRPFIANNFLKWVARKEGPIEKYLHLFYNEAKGFGIFHIALRINGKFLLNRTGRAYIVIDILREWLRWQKIPYRDEEGLVSLTRKVFTRLGYQRYLTPLLKQVLLKAEEKDFSRFRRADTTNDRTAQAFTVVPNYVVFLYQTLKTIAKNVFPDIRYYLHIGRDVVSIWVNEPPQAIIGICGVNRYLRIGCQFSFELRLNIDISVDSAILHLEGIVSGKTIYREWYGTLKFIGIRFVFWNEAIAIIKHFREIGLLVV